MLIEKYTNFIDRVSTNLISSYEEATNKKYNPKDIYSIIDVVNFLNGNVVYLDGMYSKYNTDEILLSKEDGFTIIIDKEYREKQFEKTEVSIKKMIFRMVFMYIDEFITSKGKISSNVIIYPQNSDINLEELLKDILGIKEEKIRVKIEESTEEPKFDCLEVPNKKAFIVAQEKSEDFKKVKPNFKDRQHMEEMLEKFKVNNLVKSGPKLVKKNPFKK